MKIHGKNGKMIALLESPPASICSTERSSCVLTSAGCDGDEGEQDIDRQRKKNL